MILRYQHFDLLGKSILERVVFQPPFLFKSDMQDESCLFYNIKGDSKIYSTLNSTQLNENECAILKCGRYFSNQTASKSGMPSDVVAVHFYPEVIKLAFENGIPNYFVSATTQKPTSAINKITVDKILQNYIQSLLLLFENPTIVTDELIAHKVKEVLLILINTNSEESEKIKTIISDIFNPNQASFKDIVNAHCYDNLTTSQLAYLCNMSLSTFKRRFLELYQQNPGTYLRNKKLDRAAHLLKTTTESIASICYDTGFSDTSNFTKSFTAKFECTPSAFRNMRS